MDSMSNKAGRFVVVASFPRTEGVGAKEAAPTKAYSFAPNATISDVFDAIWPKNRDGDLFFTPPSKIEIMPDEITIPEAPKRYPFDGLFEANAEK
ncbi:hypothetical protein HFO70_18700 [Rhizobium laguerreae]|uniref:hypothetical protein n=1 Tax=Rhizobium laguerreae TaxID=1076926 RepID=UPI001C91CC2F|nr:hypothetical protein [Rhizobium laguerreae]MBY3086042.1 hypothetical protein [Rhizobium laguerreae]